MLLVQPNVKQYTEYLDFAREKKIGFELMSFCYPAVLDSKDAKNGLFKRYKEAPVYSMHGPFIDINYSGGDPLIYKASVKRITQCASIARRMHFKKIVLHSCFFPTMLPSDMLYDIWSEKSASTLIPIAEKYDVEFLIENVLDITPDIICKMISKAHHARINVCLDVGHTNLSKAPLDEWVGRLAEHIKYVHLSDNHGIFDEHIGLGEGNIDWVHFDSLVKKYGIEADYTLEVNSLDRVKSSYEFLRSKELLYVN